MNKLKLFAIRFLVVLLAIQATVAAQLLNLPAAKAAAPTVVINEVMWMGSTASVKDEWIELYNATNADIDIGGWLLTNAAGGTPLTIPVGIIIPANDYFLISRLRETEPNSILNVAPDLVMSDMYLDDTCAQIDLIRPFAESVPTSIVDSMGCSGSNYFFPSSAAINHSLERKVMIGDGLDPNSWQERTEGKMNLDPSLISDANDLATPKFVNDITPPTGGTVRDGGVIDVDWSANPTEMTCNWQNFVESESSLMIYNVGIGTGTTAADFVGFQKAELDESNKTLAFPAPTTSGTYYCLARAINTLGLTGPIVASDGFTIDTAAPNAPTGLQVNDAPADNGGSVIVNWLASTSLDDITYQVNYRLLGETAWTNINTGSNLSVTISGLTNFPAQYEFSVEAIDFSSLHSSPTGIVIAAAIDNIAPILDITKIQVGQNAPGSNDTVSGQAGATNENPSTLMAFKRFPVVEASDILGSVATNPDGSFPAISLGNNQVGQVWLQLVDVAGNPSVVKVVSNDILGPNAPELQTLTAECLTFSCRIELHWQDKGPDTVRYQVSFKPDGGVEQRTLDLNDTGIAIDLPPGQNVEFAVYAYDAASNSSAKSNVFRVALTSGVLTTAVLQNGEQVITTTAIGGTRETIIAPIDQITPSIIAQAADEKSGTGSTNNTPAVNTAGEQARTQDWMRVLMVIILLLIVAGGLYALSRSFNESEKVLNDPLPVGTTKRKGKPGRKKKG